MRRLGTIVVRFFFLDGRTKAIDIHPTDTALDAMLKLAEKIGLNINNGNDWAIYQSRPSIGQESYYTNYGDEEHVPQHHYLYDVIAAWEM